MDKIVKNYLYNLSYQILILIVPLITTPYVSRTLGAKGIGTFSILILLFNISSCSVALV